MREWNWRPASPCSWESSTCVAVQFLHETNCSLINSSWRTSEGETSRPSSLSSNELAETALRRWTKKACTFSSRYYIVWRYGGLWYTAIAHHTVLLDPNPMSTPCVSSDCIWPINSSLCPERSNLSTRDMPSYLCYARHANLQDWRS